MADIPRIQHIQAPQAITNQNHRVHKADDRPGGHHHSRDDHAPEEHADVLELHEESVTITPHTPLSDTGESSLDIVA